MAVAGAKPKADRSQVRHRNPVADWTEVENVPFEGGPDLLPRASTPESEWAAAGVIPGDGWPPATDHWWKVIRAMPHAKLWETGDWAFAQMTAEVHARTAEGWRGYTGAELRQREKLLGVYADARRDLRIRYIAPKNETDPPAGGDNVVSMSQYREL